MFTPNSVWDLFKVNNKDTRTTLLLILNRFHKQISIVNFKQVTLLFLTLVFGFDQQIYLKGFFEICPS